MTGEWGFTQIKDLPLTGEWSEAINGIPIAVKVCIPPDCSRKLKEALWKLSPIKPEFINEGTMDMLKLGEEIMDYAGETAFMGVARGMGLQLNEFASLIGSIALYVAVNSTIIATQIELFEKGDGVCLHKGPLPWPFPVKVGPFLLDIPVVVSPREPRSLAELVEE